MLFETSPLQFEVEAPSLPDYLAFGEAFSKVFRSEMMTSQPQMTALKQEED